MIILDYYHVDSFEELSEYNKGVAGEGDGEGRCFSVFFFFADCPSTVARYIRS